MPIDASLLAEVSMFRLIDDAERATLAALLEPRHAAAGETVFHEGEPGDEVILVSEGRVQVFITSDMGERIVLAEYARGDVFGEISLLDGGPRTATAVASEPSELLALDRDRLLELVQRHPHVALDLLTVMGQRLRGTDELLRIRATKNLYIEGEDEMTFGQRIADKVASFGGSWTFILMFGGFLVIWVTVNSILLARRAFDPFPYILLNLFLSMIAALQAPVIMMSQNRQSIKDRLKADMDYEVNLKSELEVAQLHRKIDHLTERFEAAMPRVKRVSSPGM